ncbi:hypothetical protein E2C01_038345 [Portunus trituberculatus]|uniref:Uncharacterized protein n=1 Tax=Portunus trituberculatus TaxID=210409 RepID=A0A5B7FGK4_PORTR|nr:hypothetical protein [Portunus trituberculatus]
MILGRTSLLLCIQPQRWVYDRNSNHSRENQHNTSSGPSNWQGQNARGTSTLGNPEKGLEK